ncbi:MAG: hypothetical protein CBC55_02085 [Gammaproteobacteria bacterium TMED95]|nr:MAG: hypothetical protein CBC55_02085 [Gammaproteobacteria bacterium TMED95]|tara:strand:- start:3530 stop:4144 length:615 start_codon:yes stop_codon:yes gene_type:complete
MKNIRTIRLIAIEAILVGGNASLSREKLMKMTGVGPAQVTRTIREYRDLFPDNLKFGTAKHYEPTDAFAPSLLSESALKDLKEKGETACLYQALERTAKFDVLDAFIDAQLVLKREVVRDDFEKLFGAPPATVTRAIRRARERTGKELKFDSVSGAFKLVGVLKKSVRLLKEDSDASTFMGDVVTLIEANAFAERKLSELAELA